MISEARVTLRTVGVFSFALSSSAGVSDSSGMESRLRDPLFSSPIPFNLLSLCEELNCGRAAIKSTEKHFSFVQNRHSLLGRGSFA